MKREIGRKEIEGRVRKLGRDEDLIKINGMRRKEGNEGWNEGE